ADHHAPDREGLGLRHPGPGGGLLRLPDRLRRTHAGREEAAARDLLAVRPGRGVLVRVRAGRLVHEPVRQGSDRPPLPGLPALSPVGLSSVTKLSSKGRVGQMMGVWFVGASLGNFVAGLVAGSLENMAPFVLFRTVAMIIGGAGLFALLMSPVVKKLAGQVD